MQTHNKLQTRLLTTDYVIWRLDKQGLLSKKNDENGGDLTTFDKIDLKKNSKFKLCSIMRELSFEFEKNFGTFIISSINQLDLKSNSLKDTFFSIALELFQVNSNKSKSYLIRRKSSLNENELNENIFECNWGRIIGIFAFSACLAVKIASQISASNDSNMNLIRPTWKNDVYNLIDWLTQFLNNEPRIFDWIENNGGWNGFIEYYNERNSSNENKIFSSVSDYADYLNQFKRDIPKKNNDLNCYVKSFFDVSQAFALTFAGLGIKKLLISFLPIQ